MFKPTIGVDANKASRIDGDRLGADFYDDSTILRSYSGCAKMAYSPWSQRALVDEGLSNAEVDPVREAGFRGGSLVLPSAQAGQSSGY
jgi:hypothetical protein